MTQTTPFLNQTTFQLSIEKNVCETGASYIEAVLEFCDENDMEFDVVKKLMTQNLKDKLKLDAIDGGYMRQESRLPLEDM